MRNSVKPFLVNGGLMNEFAGKVKFRVESKAKNGTVPTEKAYQLEFIRGMEKMFFGVASEVPKNGKRADLICWKNEIGSFLIELKVVDYFVKDHLEQVMGYWHIFHLPSFLINFGTDPPQILYFDGEVTKKIFIPANDNKINSHIISANKEALELIAIDRSGLRPCQANTRPSKTKFEYDSSSSAQLSTQSTAAAVAATSNTLANSKNTNYSQQTISKMPNLAQATKPTKLDKPSCHPRTMNSHDTTKQRLDQVAPSTKLTATERNDGRLEPDHRRRSVEKPRVKTTNPKAVKSPITFSQQKTKSKLRKITSTNDDDRSGHWKWME
jgi:hypothetical protein